MCTDPCAPTPSPEPAHERAYTVIGFWDDSDRVIITGIFEGDPEVFGGEDCTEGGPWTEIVTATDRAQAERAAAEAAEAATRALYDDVDLGEPWYPDYHHIQ